MAPAPIKLSRTRQTGALLVATSVLLVIVGTIAATYLLEVTVNRAQREGSSQQAQMINLKNAISAFVAVNQRLPCPADGSLGSGNPNRGVELRDPSGICTSAGPGPAANQQTGIIPWVTLGIGEREAFSADLTYYSYRVYSGLQGLTVNNGAAMTLCDTDNGPTADVPLSSSNGQCTDTNHNSTSAQFLTGKGLTVVTDTGNITNIAYVLIHHGKSSSGAFLQSGFRNAQPNATVVKEYGNTLGTSDATYTATYTATTPNTNVPSDNPAYFDDRVQFARIDDLAKSAGIYARNWPDSPLTIAAADLIASFSPGASTGAFSGGTVAASGSVGNTLTDLTTGIGVAGAGGGGDQVRGTDVLTFTFDKSYSTFAVIFSSLARQAGLYEGATATLKDAGGATVGTVFLKACAPAVLNDASTFVAFDNITIGIAFRTVELRPNIPSDASVYVDTDFILNAISVCDGSGASCLSTSVPITASCPFILG